VDFELEVHERKTEQSECHEQQTQIVSKFTIDVATDVPIGLYLYMRGKISNFWKKPKQYFAFIYSNGSFYCFIFL